MNLPFAPLLSATIDIKKDPEVLSKLRYPGYGSPKLDGIRGVVRKGQVVSRTMKPLPSKQVQDSFSHLEHMDGEVIAGEPTAPDAYHVTESHVMSADKPAEQLTYYVFDWAEESWADRPYSDRLDHLDGYVQRYQSLGTLNVVLVPQRWIRNAEELAKFETEMLELGYEGIMYRSAEGPYRVPSKSSENRPTFKMGILGKLKRFEDIEAVVVGFIERYRNDNEAKKDAFGRTKRGASKEGKVAAGTLGKFIVLYNGVRREVPTGKFKKPELQHIWDHQAEFMHKLLKVRHFPHGAKVGLRAPRAIGWRHAIDV